MTDLSPAFPGSSAAGWLRLCSARMPRRVVALVEPRMLETARDGRRGLDAERIELVGGRHHRSPARASSADDYERLPARSGASSTWPRSTTSRSRSRSRSASTSTGPATCSTSAAPPNGLERLAYVTTAYVAGKRTGVVYEHELVMGQAVQEPLRVDEVPGRGLGSRRARRVPTTILARRSSSATRRTGETEKFDGPYYILRALEPGAAHGPADAAVRSLEAAFNVVPVDYVVAAMVAAAGDPATVGQTLHLVDPDPLSAHELVELLSRALHRPRGRAAACPPAWSSARCA